jgi:hypothetical protein
MCQRGQGKSGTARATPRSGLPFVHLGVDADQQTLAPEAVEEVRRGYARHLDGGEVTFSIAATSGNTGKMMYGAGGDEVGDGGRAV